VNGRRDTGVAATSRKIKGLLEGAAPKGEPEYYGLLGPFLKGMDDLQGGGVRKKKSAREASTPWRED